jgi:uncharacterized protein (TIGR03066 family)
MNVLRFAFLGCLISGLIGCGTPTTSSVTPHTGGGSGKTPSTPAHKPEGGTPAATGEKPNKDKIVGAWEVTKSESGGPVGATIDFTKDGKMKMSMKTPDGKTVEMEGRYEVEGDKVTAITKGPDGKEKKEPGTITKLTDKEMSIKDEKGKTDEYKKK